MNCVAAGYPEPAPRSPASIAAVHRSDRFTRIHRFRPAAFAVAVCIAAASASTAIAEDSPAIAEIAVETPPSKVALTIAGWDDVQKRVAAARGKVVVVNVWTTTCATCREEFPHFLKLTKLAGRDRLMLVTVACDYDGIAEKPPEFYREKVTRFLAGHNHVAADHFLLNRAFVDFLEDQKLGSTPAVFVYGADGRLVKRFDNDKATRTEEEFATDDVRKQIESAFQKP